MSLPVFTSAPVLVIDEGKFGTHVDHANRPRCRLCPEDGPVDVESGLGAACWRVLVALPVVLEERAAAPLRTLAPIADIESARGLRDGTPLSAEARAGAGGVTPDVDLGRAPRRKR